MLLHGVAQCAEIKYWYIKVSHAPQMVVNM